MISINQKAFIAERRILDGFIITNEMVYEVKKKGRHGFILKVDFHKAFDSI